MRIIVLGAGAIGSVYGAKLSRFHDVTLIGGTPHVEAIRKDGLTLQGLENDTFRLRALTTVDAIEPGTLILLPVEPGPSSSNGNSDARLRVDGVAERWVAALIGGARPLEQGRGV